MKAASRTSQSGGESGDRPGRLRRWILTASLASVTLAPPLTAQAPSQTAGRKALVIGNASYARVPAVGAAIADARLTADSLKATGFTVTVLENASLAALQRAIQSFVGQIQAGETSVFAYFGHGLQVDGDNYLAPVDFDPQSPAEIYTRAYSLSAIRELIQDRGALLKIMILDAAHPGGFQNLRAGAEGLAPPLDLGAGTLLFFSAQPGKSGMGTAGRASGLLAPALSKALAEPGLTLDDVFRHAQRTVNEESGGQQLPFVASTVVTPFFFRYPLPDPEPPAPVVVTTTQPVAPKLNRVDRLEYVWIPPGEFQMGCLPKDPECAEDEKPRRAVKISKGFWMGKTEVTVLAYRRYTEAKKQRMPPNTQVNPGWRSTDHPITEVTWENARSYCAWVGGDLPTEAEWEYAARGGSPDTIYAWETGITRERANYDGTEGNDRWPLTAPVASFDPNGFGLYDMSGNAWELTKDFYQRDYYANSPPEDPPGPQTGNAHVTRGGSWNSALTHLRLSVRRPVPVQQRGNHIGFRCVVPDLP